MNVLAHRLILSANTSTRARAEAARGGKRARPLAVPFGNPQARSGTGRAADKPAMYDHGLELSAEKSNQLWIWAFLQPFLV